VTPLNSKLKEQKIVFKPELLQHEKVCGVIGLSGTFDQHYGRRALKHMFGDFIFFRAPSMLNSEVALNFKQGFVLTYCGTD
jgi:hypothetical protein